MRIININSLHGQSLQLTLEANLKVVLNLALFLVCYIKLLYFTNWPLTLWQGSRGVWLSRTGIVGLLGSDFGEALGWALVTLQGW